MPGGFARKFNLIKDGMSYFKRITGHHGLELVLIIVLVILVLVFIFVLM